MVLHALLKLENKPLTEDNTESDQTNNQFKHNLKIKSKVQQALMYYERPNLF